RSVWAGQKEMFLFSIGGSIHTADQWQVPGHVPGLPPSSARVLYKNGAFYLAPGMNGQLTDFGKTGLELEGEKGGVQCLVMGRTYYGVNFDDEKMVLIPFARQDTWSMDQKIPRMSGDNIKQTYTTMDWNGDGLSFWAWCIKHVLFCIAGVIVSFLCGAAVSIHYAAPYKRRNSGMNQPLGGALPAVTAVSCVMTGLLITWMWHTGEIGIGTLLCVEWIAWGMATLFIGLKYNLNGLFGRLWICCIVLCGAGTLILVQLGAGAENLVWLSYGKKHIVLMTLFAVALQILVLMDEAFLKDLSENLLINDSLIYRLLRTGVVLISLLVMFIQLFFGEESGVLNFQPAEGAKLLFVIVAAFIGLHLGELRRHNSDLYQQQPVKYLYDILIVFFLFCLALLVVLIGVRDMSPVVIMGVLFLSWLWIVSPHPWQTGPSHKFWRTVIMAAVFLVCYVGQGIYSDPENIPGWIPQKDRFQVWAAPDRYPHSGAQVLKSMALCGVGGWTGAEPSWFGKNNSIYQLPAVQDDFIVGFVLYKFGGLPGLMLALAQIFTVLTLFQISRAAGLWAETSGSFKNRQTGKVLSMIVFGLAWIYIAQWTISWADALGLLPIMGQPMTWISSANSHMVFIGFPAVIFAYLSFLHIDS
ncbi:MAG: hypothetical protein U9P10_11110, partial [Thermodesulfobacteriota bacterium]|nr:hypothetical protein [Thermodesulfobacteriota bacterium]